MTIRQATLPDLPRLRVCAQDFAAASRHIRGFDMDRFIAVWTGLLESGAGVIFLLADDQGEIAGMLGGVAYPDIYSGEMIASEFFWFVREQYRGGTGSVRLYREFEDWARARGCTQIRMIHLSDSMPEKLDKFYRRLGFEPIEVHWAKQFD